jgi:hypothetical protein
MDGEISIFLRKNINDNVEKVYKPPNIPPPKTKVQTFWRHFLCRNTDTYVILDVPC